MHLPVQTCHLRHRAWCVAGSGSGEFKKAHKYQNTNGWPALCPLGYAVVARVVECRIAAQRLDCTMPLSVVHV